MALAIGSRIGSYEVVSAIGEGGMGEVYRARDTTLHRDVALKVLPDHLASNAERLSRFKREAQLLASLNHPNIAAVYGFEQTSTGSSIVLELVDGPTLADRILEGPLPIDEALSIARQIAEALEAAHAHGIVHRDLKPANVKVREDGTVKVLDFGLAKIMDEAGRSVHVASDGTPNQDSPYRASPDLALSPTITTPAMTQAGLILGTAAYMSPEQAKGKSVDKRTDIWAYGCILLEMLTGKRVFDAEDVSDTLAAVLRAQPDFTTLPSGVPPSIRALIERCFERDLKRRVGDISTAIFVLDEHARMARPVTSDSAPPRTTSLVWWRGAVIGTVGAIVGAAVVAGVWRARFPDAPRVTRLTIMPSETAALSEASNYPSLTVTPDGRRIVYAGANGTQLFVRALDSLEPTLLSGLSSPQQPFISPDGQSVGYGEGSTSLKRVAITGGPPLLITRLDGTGVRGATWGPDGTIVYATLGASGLMRVSEGGGEPKAISNPDSGDHLWPEFLPGGHALVFTIAPAGSAAYDTQNARVAVLDLRTGVQKVLFSGGSRARYVSSGHLVYATSGSLSAIAFDLDRLETRGAPVPVVPDVRTVLSGAADFAVARDGTLVYVPGGVQSGARTLVWVDRQGREAPIDAPPRAYVYPRLSPDGTRIALDVRDQDNDIWIWDFKRLNLTKFTFDVTLDRNPVWTPDGRRILFSSGAGVRSGANLFSQAADLTGAPERLTESADVQFVNSISPDGTRAVFWQQRQSRDTMLLTLDGARRAEPLLQGPGNEFDGEISPNGRWIAYQSDQSGREEIYVRPFPDVNSGGLRQITTSGGTRPAWSRDGRELFYLVPVPRTTMMSVPVETGGAWSAGSPIKLFEGPYYNGVAGNNVNRTYDVANDGKRFLMIKEPVDQKAGPASVVVVQNWMEELKRLVARN